MACSKIIAAFGVNILVLPLADPQRCLLLATLSSFLENLFAKKHTVADCWRLITCSYDFSAPDMQHLGLLVAEEIRAKTVKVGFAFRYITSAICMFDRWKALGWIVHLIR